MGLQSLKDDALGQVLTVLVCICVAVVGIVIYQEAIERTQGYVILEEGEGYIQIKIKTDEGRAYIDELIRDGWKIVGVSGASSSTFTLTKGD